MINKSNDELLRMIAARDSMIRELLSERETFARMVGRMRELQWQHQFRQGPWSKEAYATNPIEGIEAEVEKTSAIGDVDSYLRKMGYGNRFIHEDQVWK
jgi:hypothetical protein